MRFTAFRFALDVSPGQVGVLRRHVGASRFGYNRCLGLVKQALAARVKDPGVKVPWSGFDLINSFNGWKRSPEAGRVWAVNTAGEAEEIATGLVWRGLVLQQVFEEAAVDLGRGLAGFTASRGGRHGRGGRAGRGRGVGFPRFKRKRPGGGGSFRVRNKISGGRAAIRVGEDGPRSVRLPRIGVLPVREDTRRLRRMLRSGRAQIVAATVSCRAGRWSVALTVQAADLHPTRQHPAGQHPAGQHPAGQHPAGQHPAGQHPAGQYPAGGEPGDGANGGWVGVDRGLTAFVVAATSTGRQVLRVDDPPRPLRTAAGRLRRLSRRAGRKRKGSANRAKAVARLGRAHARVRDVRQQFLHEVANQLVNTHDQLAVEDLNITGMLANHRMAAAISDAGWAELARIITYKQAWRGGQVMVVDRWFPSTKTCHHCQTTLAAALPLSQRIFTCPTCGYQADRDLNAAANLAAWAEQHHAQTRDPDARGPVTNASREDDPATHHTGARPHRPQRRKNPTTTNR